MSSLACRAVVDDFFALAALGSMKGCALLVRSSYESPTGTYLAALGGSTGVTRGKESMIIPAEPLAGAGQPCSPTVQLRSHHAVDSLVSSRSR